MRSVADGQDARQSRTLQPLPMRMEWSHQWKTSQTCGKRIRSLHPADQNLRYQQNLAGRRIAILELSTNDLRRILAADSSIIEAVATINAGEYLQLEIV